jgi:hypothetical protein
MSGRPILTGSSNQRQATIGDSQTPAPAKPVLARRFDAPSLAPVATCVVTAWQAW